MDDYTVTMGNQCNALPEQFVLESLQLHTGS